MEINDPSLPAASGGTGRGPGGRGMIRRDVIAAAIGTLALLHRGRPRPGRRPASPEHPVRHRRRLGVRARRGLWVRLGEDPGVRSGGPRGRALHQRLHQQPQVQPLSGEHPDRAEFVATGGSELPQRHLPGQMAGLPGPAGAGRLPRRVHRQGVGAGRLQGRGVRAEPGGPGVQPLPQGAAAPGDGRRRLRPQLRGLPVEAARRASPSPSGTGRRSHTGRTRRGPACVRVGTPRPSRCRPTTPTPR